MIYLVIVATLAAIFFLLFELRKLRRGSVPAETAIQELDIDALSNLLDERQANFVRARLSPASYRRYERRKSRVLLGYLGLMSAFLEARIRSLSASAEDVTTEKAQLELFIQSRQLVLRAQILLWLYFLLPAGVQLSQYAQGHCRALAASLRNDLAVARTSLAS